jgi:hypothetical protein
MVINEAYTSVGKGETSTAKKKKLKKYMTYITQFVKV